MRLSTNWLKVLSVTVLVMWNTYQWIEKTKDININQQNNEPAFNFEIVSKNTETCIKVTISEERNQYIDSIVGQSEHSILKIITPKESTQCRIWICAVSINWNAITFIWFIALIFGILFTSAVIGKVKNINEIAHFMPPANSSIFIPQEPDNTNLAVHNRK